MCIKRFCKNLRSVQSVYPSLFLSFNDFRNFASFRLRILAPLFEPKPHASASIEFENWRPIGSDSASRTHHTDSHFRGHLSLYLAIFEYSRSHEAAAFRHIEARFVINERLGQHRLIFGLIRVLHCSDKVRFTL